MSLVYRYFMLQHTIILDIIIIFNKTITVNNLTQMVDEHTCVTSSLKLSFNIHVNNNNHVQEIAVPQIV